jgi:hypothetical protein
MKNVRSYLQISNEINFDKLHRKSQITNLMAIISVVLKLLYIQGK